MTEYRHIITPTPPVIRQRDGQWYVIVAHGELSIEAPIGQWFLSELFTKVIVPQIVTRPQQAQQEDAYCAPSQSPPSTTGSSG
jgi:hypothetical protein